MEDNIFLKLIDLKEIKQLLINEPQLSIIFEVLCNYINIIINKNNKYKILRDELNLLSTNLNQKKCEILTQENIINKRNRELKKKEKEFNIQLKKQFKKTNINQ